MKRQLSTFSVLPVSAFAAAGLALASTVAAVNPADAFTLSINPNNTSTEKTGASALLDFDFEQQGDNVVLKLNVKNTTDGTTGAGATRATFVGVAFDLAAGLTGSNLNSGGTSFTKLWDGVRLSGGGFGDFDMGISTPRNSFEGGNANGGLTAGNSMLLSLVLSGQNLKAADVEKAFFTGFQSGDLRAAGRFQQVGGASGYTGGSSDKVMASLLPTIGSEPSGSPAAAVPEPTTMVGAAVVAGVVALRKKFKKQPEA
jgi:hypothetical protein